MSLLKNGTKTILNILCKKNVIWLKHVILGNKVDFQYLTVDYWTSVSDGK